jgi:ribose 5-phosphate isomerase B
MEKIGKLYYCMKIFIGSDRLGFDLKLSIIQYLTQNGHDVIDAGPLEYKSVHYPEIAIEVSLAVVKNKTFGILICNSGIGMSIASNKVKGIRASNCNTIYLAGQSRIHNDANVLCLGSGKIKIHKAIKIVDKFLFTNFGKGKHIERVKMINEINL